MTSEAILRAYLDAERYDEEPYAWIITVDYLDPEAPNDEGTAGPRDASEDLLDRLRKGEGYTFRIRDDDGELYYEGRCSEIDHFGPLDDFGTPNAGATEILYRHGNRYVML